MKVTIVSPEKIIFEGEAQSLTVPGMKGQFEILDHHAPIISSLGPGNVICHATGITEQAITIMGGFVEVSDNKVTLCVEM